jgi:predicted PurR-regulated permease PerM
MSTEKSWVSLALLRQEKMYDFFLMVIMVSIIAMVIAAFLAAVGWAGIGLYMFWGLKMNWVERWRRRRRRC